MKLNRGILFFLEEVCLIVSSYKITPPMHSLIDKELKRVSLNNNLFSGVDITLTLSNLFCHCSSAFMAAKIPFPLSSISSAILFNSDILI